MSSQLKMYMYSRTRKEMVGKEGVGGRILVRVDAMAWPCMQQQKQLCLAINFAIAFHGETVTDV